jgi:hypothetical protein
MKIKQLLFISIFSISSFLSFAQNSKLAQTTITDNLDGTATVTATIVGDLTQLSGDNVIKISGGKYTSDLIPVTSEQITIKGTNVMVIKMIYPIDSTLKKDRKNVTVEVHLGIVPTAGILRRFHVQDAIVAEWDAVLNEELQSNAANPLFQE